MPTQFLHALQESGDASLSFRIVHDEVHQRADAPHAVTRLGPRRKRPCDRCAAEQCDEFAPSHSITSSALASRVAGTSIPIVLAVCRLMASSNLLGRSTGRSAGFSPLRTRPA